MARFEEFWDVVCSYRDYLWLGVMVMLFFFFLDVFALLFVPWGTPSFWIAVLNFAMIVGAGGTMVWMFWVCDRQAERSYKYRSDEQEG